VSIERVAVVGAGRVGLSLARALARSGRSVAVLARHAVALPGPLDAAITVWGPAVAAADLLIVAVPDDALGGVALVLAQTLAIEARHVVLHTSGLHDRSVLAVLQPSGAALGSWHPLQTFVLPAGEPGALAGSPVVIEGDVRALAAGRALAELLHLRPIVELAAEQKASYHAGAVVASNYLVVLADIAARLAREAGAGEASAQLFLPLMRRTLANYGTSGAAALTGPISRGDAGTVARHLEALEGSSRVLYVALGREALRMARQVGLDEAAARRIEELLSTDR
jgi:predicted short-subunit dehydrogenase-like oxidoreductase (DUF2520 family)